MTHEIDWVLFDRRTKRTIMTGTLIDCLTEADAIHRRDPDSNIGCRKAATGGAS